MYNKTMLARDLRKAATLEEKIIWEKIRNRKFHNLKFKRQYVIEGFVVDFYCHELSLAIEIDGKIHEEQIEYDNARQMIIESTGINFIRITNEEINNNLNILLNKIKTYIKTPSPVGEGRGEGKTE